MAHYMLTFSTAGKLTCMELMSNEEASKFSSERIQIGLCNAGIKLICPATATLGRIMTLVDMILSMDSITE